MSGFGIYVHWPYLRARSVRIAISTPMSATRFRRNALGDAILRELRTVVAELQSERPTVASIFFGGGTPSLMSGARLARCSTASQSYGRSQPMPRSRSKPIPTASSRTRFRDYRAAGVNRVSIGVQSLDDAALKALGRLHGVDEARNAIALARDIFPRAASI